MLIFKRLKDIYNTLGPRLLAGVLLVFLCVFIVMFPLAERRAYQQEVSAVGEVLSSLLDARARALDNHIGQYESDTLFLANTPPISGIMRASENSGEDPDTRSNLQDWQQRLQEIFSAYMYSRGEVRQLRFIGMDDGGRELVRVDSDGESVQIIPQSQLQQKGHSDYVKESSKLNEGEVYFSRVNFNRERGKIERPLWPTLRIATPVFDAQQRLFGVVVMNLDFSYSQRLIREDLPQGYRVYLLDEEQHFLLHPYSEKTLAYELGPSYQWGQAFDAPMADGLRPYRERGGEATWYSLKQRLTYDDRHWVTLVVAADQALVDDAVFRMLRFNAAVFVCFTLITFILLLQFVVNMRRRDEAIERNAERVAIIDGSNDAVIAVSLDGVVISWNAAAELLFGYREDEVVGKTTASLILPDDCRDEEQLFLKQMRAGVPVPHVETHRKDKSGNRIEVAINVSPVKVAGKITSAAMIVRDISQEKESRSKLRQLNESLEEVVAQRTKDLSETLATQRAILEKAGYGIIASDPRGKITLFNSAAEKMLGYRQEEVVGQRYINSFFVGDEFNQALRDKAIEQGGELDTYSLLKAGFSDEREWVFRRRDGQEFPVLLKTVSMLSDEGDVLGFLSVAVDLTTRKQEQRELEHARAVAEDASKAKSEFLANMSHEIRTPMNAVLGMLNLLDHTGLNARQRDYVQKASGAAEALLGIINDILDFSKIEAGKLLLDPHPFSVDEVLRDIANILSMNVDEKQLEILFNVDPAIPSQVCGDALRIKQVLINLAGNAVKFTDSGEVMISVVVQHQQRQRIVLGFSVRDTGIGMSVEQQQRIFQSFSQAEAGTTRRYGGTGLGLVICQRLIRMMGGELEVDSEEGRGSTFSFSLLLENVEGAERSAPRARELSQGLQGLRILCIDDNANARQIISTSCESMGWHCDEAADGESGVEKIRAASAPYDVVFIDWMMPGMNGWQTAEAIRREQGERCPKLVMVTAHAKDVYAQEEREGGSPMDGFLMKPVTASDIFNAVSEALTHAVAPSLPARAEPVDAVSEVDDSDKNEVVRPVAKGSLAGMRLLLVEDNLTNQQVARELLALEGAEIELAENGLEALEQIRTSASPFDAVLMDLQMPEMDGLTATRKIRQEMGLVDLPIIAMTANALPSDRKACLDAGMNDHVGKPFELSELVDAVLKAAGREAVADESVVVERVEPDLPASPEGFNFKEALLRMGNNRGLLATQARRFADRHCGDLKLVEKSLRGNNAPLATRELHTVRGVAATLGASALAQMLGDLEDACKQGASADALAEDLQRADAELKRACAVFSELANQLTPAPNAGDEGHTKVDAAQLLSGCEELEALLRDSNMRAMAVHDTLRAEGGLAAVAGAEILAESIASLDFAGALAALERVKAELDAQNSNTEL
jgi:PAS domain S-box-containing protein